MGIKERTAEQLELSGLPGREKGGTFQRSDGNRAKGAVEKRAERATESEWRVGGNPNPGRRIDREIHGGNMNSG